MTTWVLIVASMGYYGLTYTTHSFNTFESCVKAQQWIESNSARQFKVTTSCIKDTP